MSRVTSVVWSKKTCRFLLTVTFAALLGIAAGHVVLGISGSISVVDGMSMAPTYQPGARVFTSPVDTPLQRGEIVLVDDHCSDYAMKRIVGLPGETVQLWRGYVFINCRMLREPYLPKYTYTFPDETTEVSRVFLRDDEYFVLGDNRTCSIDSRRFGPVHRTAIKARVPGTESVKAYCVNYTLPVTGRRGIRALTVEHAP